MSRRRGIVVLAALLALAGCAPAPPAAGFGLTLTFAGDVHFEGRVDGLLSAPATAFGSAAGELARGDLTFVNLETPITGRGTPEDKRYLFRARDEAVPAMTAAGIDAVSLANNHTMDYGRQGLLDTIRVARAGNLGTVGAGADADAAYTPWRRTVRGIRVAALAFDQVAELGGTWAAGPGRPGMAVASDRPRALAAVRAARASSDVVVVLAHWGVEGRRCVDQRQRDFAADLVEAGADIVVGAHAHVLQGAGRLGAGYVAYGMGNFLWYSGGLEAPYSARSGLLHLSVQGRRVVRQEFVPTVVSSSGRPEVVTGWRASVARRNFAELSSCAGVAPSVR